MISEPFKSWSGLDFLQCECCGEPAVSWPEAARDDRNGGRCERHRGRNPCVIEGCKRTTEAPEGRLSTLQWFCGEHWRRFCPPRSRRRRAYHAFFRLAKRHGWTYRLNSQYWRFWYSLVAVARAEADPERQIQRMSTDLERFIGSL